MSNRRNLNIFIILLAIIFTFSLGSLGEAQTKGVRLSIATGGTGGVYYPLGGGMAQVISKYIPNTEATAEVTAGSVDNCKLIQTGKAELALIMADIGFDALKGEGRFKAGGAIPLRTIGVVYSNYMHFVTMEGSGIKTVSDLKGKRVSTGSPGSGTEVKTMRVLESYGIDGEKDLKRDRLGVAESAGALKDRKIDAFTWDGGLPTAAVLDIAATPGIKIKILNNADHLDKMNQKYGPVYFKLTIPKIAYPHMDADASVVGVANLLVCHEKMDPALAYNITKFLLEKQPELVAVHKEALNFTLATATLGSSLPFHPGAIKYYQEKGIVIK
ncbi:MAG: TAXI family TRAP transporter solute-binding subunit [Thermodesulfobacteriota bacterium]|nr:TAXI family TRAP transporter solute-binding subunit [Thermodesulfobacteriota bacterium]